MAQAFVKLTVVSVEARKFAIGQVDTYLQVGEENKISADHSALQLLQEAKKYLSDDKNSWEAILPIVNALVSTLGTGKTAKAAVFIQLADEIEKGGQFLLHRPSSKEEPISFFTKNQVIKDMKLAVHHLTAGLVAAFILAG